MKKLKQGGEVRYLVQSHPVTKSRFEPRLFDSRVCSLNSTILLLIRILHIPYWKGASLLTNSIKSCAERKCLSSPLSVMYVLSSVGFLVYVKSGKRMRIMGRQLTHMIPKNLQYFTIQWEGHRKKRSVWAGTQWNFSAEVGLPWVLKNKQDLD